MNQIQQKRVGELRAELQKRVDDIPPNDMVISTALQVLTEFLLEQLVRLEELMLTTAEEINSPSMPPKSKFKADVHVQSVTKGRPSVCDESED